MGVHRKNFILIKLIFHLRINGRAQERNFNYIKIFCMVFVVLYSYTCMYTKYNYTYKSMFGYIESIIL